MPPTKQSLSLPYLPAPYFPTLNSKSIPNPIHLAKPSLHGTTSPTKPTIHQSNPQSITHAPRTRLPHHTLHFKSTSPSEPTHSPGPLPTQHLPPCLTSPHVSPHRHPATSVTSPRHTCALQTPWPIRCGPRDERASPNIERLSESTCRAACGWLASGFWKQG